MSLDQDIERLRAFNRFYTSRIGVLVERPYGGDFSLTETRVLYELAHRDGLRASDLAGELGLDAGYLSRMLARFARLGLLKRTRDQSDGRAALLSLTKAGRTTFAPLNAASEAAIANLLAPLSPQARRDLVAAASTMRAALQDDAASTPIHLRDLQIGDVGWITSRQGVLYHQEYGWDVSYEALVAEILAQFVRSFDPAHDGSWIAERDGKILGSVFLVKGEQPETARLRLLYVEPAARGQGVGAKLVAACIEGARAAGYRRMVLWTQSILTSAHRIYQAAGFQLVEEKPHHSFGKDLVGQTWAMEL